MSLAEFCVRRPAFTTVLIMSLVVTGLFSFRDLNVDLLPKADPATVSVTVRLPGASPDEMSSSIAEPLEQALAGVAGVDQMESRLGVGSARITIKFVLERDINEAAQDIREKVAGAMGRLPPQVEPPVIAKVDPGRARRSSPSRSVGPQGLRALTEIADKRIRRALEAVNGVGEVTVSGGRSREVHVERRRREARGARASPPARCATPSPQTTSRSPAAASTRGTPRSCCARPAGSSESSEFGQIVVASPGGAPIRVADVADGRGHGGGSAHVRLPDGQRAVVVDVRRQSGQNTIRVIEDVKAALGRAQAAPAERPDDGLHAR